MFEDFTENELNILINITSQDMEKLKSFIRIHKHFKSNKELENAKNKLDETASLYTKLLMLRY